jgi:hypothetical protein
LVNAVVHANHDNVLSWEALGTSVPSLIPCAHTRRTLVGVVLTAAAKGDTDGDNVVDIIIDNG